MAGDEGITEPAAPPGGSGATLAPDLAPGPAGGPSAGAADEGPDAGALLARADRARDARRWEEAAAAYGAFLRLHPGDRGILVQRGHCLKESGDPAAALALYRQALAAGPGDADIHLQIGHALKLLGRRGAAAAAYAQALALDPALPDAWLEWRAAMADTLPPPPASGPVLDLSDLVAWYGHRRVPSGMQRVQAEVAAAALEAEPGLVLAAMHPEEEGWRALPAALFHRLRYLSRRGADPEEPAWAEAVAVLAAWRRGGPVLRWGEGSVLVTLGSAWWLPHHAPALRAARAAGARHVPVLHDCGPLVLRDLAPPATRAEFDRWFSALPVLADGVVAVSRATAAEYRDLMAQYLPGWPVPPVLVVTPDGFIPGEESGEEAGEHPALPEGPYVLLVSSLEPRKNHLLALEAWRMLLRRRGAEGTPRLVFAGRRAAGAAPVLAALEADPGLAAKVTLLHGLDDRALARLYRGCLFTLYPSRHEGWGLPVSESLLHRRVPLVSDIPSLMESGRRGAVFFAPGSAGDLAAAAEGLIADPARLAAAAARIPPDGGLRPWAEVARDLLAAVASLSARKREPPPPLPPGRPVALGHAGPEGPRAALARAEVALHGGGWGPAEDWGVPVRPGGASLRLAAPGEGPARVALSLRPFPGSGDLLRLTLRRAGAEPVTADMAGRVAREIALEIGPGGMELALTLETPGGIGVEAVTVMRGASLADRVAALEGRILVPVRQG